MTTTERGEAGGFRLTVLNPGGRDPEQDFSSGPGAPDDGAHSPVNFHGYAACTRGVFHRQVRRALSEGLPVLLLLRGDFKETERALVQLLQHGLKVVVSLKETGLHQIEKQLCDPRRAARFRAIVQSANGCLAATPEALTFYGRGEFIPTPYPLDDPRWDFSRSLGERSGIFVGTREWNVPSRHHLAALVLALELGEPVTVFDQDPRRCRRILGALGLPMDSLRVLEKRLSYRDYLAEMARHKVVLQADRSAVPGQVAGDALLCRLPCVGGDGAIDRLAFPTTCGHGRSLGELRELASQLLRDPGFYSATVDASQAEARKQVSYAVVARQLDSLFKGLAAAA
ncbi:MAG: glycosyltransferase [Chthoniobacterales bacterium]